eukprot:TRINITY_DN2617_c0_g1_i1.p1 TRINITY_DN2617_c0_g1~~TRINITY_DN2617_c0_g1_i1.p1  ORF type:complete len:369 (+),score=46.82 TRINITY_DN2617_c0_g1_i1:51-1157(+)
MFADYFANRYNVRVSEKKHVAPLTKSGNGSRLNQRHGVTDREKLEKTRIKERKECFVRPFLDNSMKPELTYKTWTIDEKDRLSTDVDAEVRKERELMRWKRQQALQRKREELEQRECRQYAEVRKERELMRWKRQQALQRKREELEQRECRQYAEVEEQKQKEVERIKKMQELGLKAKRNKQSIPYNPISLQYSDSLEGQILKHRDDNLAYRAQVRSLRLQKYSNGPNNVITGEAVSLKQPVRPVTPQMLRKPTCTGKKVHAANNIDSHSCSCSSSSSSKSSLCSNSSRSATSCSSAPLSSFSSSTSCSPVVQNASSSSSSQPNPSSTQQRISFRRTSRNSNIDQSSASNPYATSYTSSFRSPTTNPT